MLFLYFSGLLRQELNKDFAAIAVAFKKFKYYILCLKVSPDHDVLYWFRKSLNRIVIKLRHAHPTKDSCELKKVLVLINIVCLFVKTKRKILFVQQIQQHVLYWLVHGDVGWRKELVSSASCASFWKFRSVKVSKIDNRNMFVSTNFRYK